jgi:UDPglucose--hexose-1-phosphate uridylyltransferase
MDEIFALVTYGLKHQWIHGPNPSLQKLLQLYQLPFLPYQSVDLPIDSVMEVLLNRGFELALFQPNTITERDAFEAYLFDLVMPTPGETKMTFLRLYQLNRQKAFQYLYQLSIDVNYIKTKRIAQNVTFNYPCEYGTIDLTINLSKPEKDPKDIAKALEQKELPKTGPKCLICKENEHNYDNARMNLRIVPITLHKRLWHFQYSPYAYYEEHCIILSDTHVPMKMCDETFHYLLDFVDFMPDYFIGSNADIPIVGGSILDHDHFQGGKHHFPIEQATTVKTYEYGDVIIKHLYWPLSTIRLESKHRDALLSVSKRIFHRWQTYDNESLGILSKSYGLHNTITPIARKTKDGYQIDIILRNNRVNETYPDGIFHPHRDVQHIKKENIGLIEAMGLAILPGRLKSELIKSLDYLTHGTKYPELAIHQSWLDSLKQSNEIHDMTDIQAAVGEKFKTVLEHAGVFKLDKKGMQAMDAFIQSCL